MERAVILYDEDCGFCRWSTVRLMSWVRTESLRAVPIQSDEGSTLLHDLSRERRLDSWHLVTPAGEVLSAGAAVAPLLRLLPAGAPLARLAAAFPRATERAYGLVARNRTRLGRLVGARACAVDPSHRPERSGRA